MDEQAIARVHRIGTKNEVRILRFICSNSIEEHILKKAQEKMGMDEMIIETGMFNQTSTESDRHEKIYDFLQKKENCESLEEEVDDDEEINTKLARSLV